MNFNFGEVLSRAGQITWRHKVLWIITVLPFSISLLLLPLWLVFVFTQDAGSNRLFELFDNQNFVIVVVFLYLVFFAASIFLQVVSRSSVSLGIYRVEAGIQPITFGDLLKSGFQYFWRIFGVGFLIVAATIVFFIAFSVVTSLLSAISIFVAFCLQPLFLLFIPLFLLLAALMEQAEAAVVADGMGTLEALRRGYDLVRMNLWKYALIILVVYIGMGILMNIIIFPLMTPMFFLMARNMETGIDFRNVLQMQAAFGVVIFPVMILIQGVALTYLKSAMIVVYLRLTRFHNPSQLVLQDVAA